MACVVLGASLLAPTAQAQSNAPERWDRAAAAAHLDERMAWWLAWPVAARDHETTCVSCHTSLPYALARPTLRMSLGQSGPAAPQAELLGHVERRVRRWSEVEPFYPDQRFGLPKTSESRGTEAVLAAVILAARDARRGRPSEAGRQALDHLWNLQFVRGEGAGAWAWLHFDLAPWESDGAAYFGAALAAVAVGLAPDGYAALPENEERLGALRAYLREGHERRSPFDRLMLLWASTEVPGLLAPAEARPVVERLGDLQRADGGWALSSLGPWQRLDGSKPERASDGYATGLAAYVLLRAGVAPSERPVASALAWLVRNQDSATGGWRAVSLNRERDPASDRARFMSDAATGFAVLALTEAERGRRR